MGSKKNRKPYKYSGKRIQRRLGRAARACQDQAAAAEPPAGEPPAEERVSSPPSAEEQRASSPPPAPEPRPSTSWAPSPPVHRGRRSPRPPRRPERQARLSCQKALKRLPESEPAGEEDQIRDIAAGLNLPVALEQPRRRCRDSADILMEEDESLQPAQEVRTRAPLDDAVMSAKPKPGSKLRYRLDTPIDLDYGQNYTGNRNSGCITTDECIVKLLQEQTKTYCGRCDRQLRFKVIGIGPARQMTAICMNTDCDWESGISEKTEKLGYFYKANLCLRHSPG